MLSRLLYLFTKLTCDERLYLKKMEIIFSPLNNFSSYYSYVTNLNPSDKIIPYLYAHLKKILLFGLPACVFFHRTTMFDLILPRLLVGDEITKKDITAMGHGGLCLQCNECRYPVCPFGR